MAKPASAQENEQNNYSIQLECLAESETAKELNQYRDTLLEYMNDEIERMMKAKSDYSYSFLTLDDIDFMDNQKIHGLKMNSSYLEYEYNADYEDFLSSIEGENELWSIDLFKDNSFYKANLVKTKSPTTIDYNIGGDWYIRLFFGEKTENHIVPYLHHDCEIVRTNINNLLSECNETETDIKVVFTNFNYPNTNCAVIFVNDKAKYIYYYSFLLPYQFTDKSKIPDDVYRSLEQAGDVIFNNFYHEKPEARKLYSYNMIMFLMSTCERYM